jgi:glycosyltransferase
MKVTIITACYNRKGTIGGAIHSVLEQDYPNIEYLIVDGASTDGSVEYIQELLQHEATEGKTELIRRHARETRFFSEPDHGMYEALNKGMRRATGDVIGLVHSDDTLINHQIVSEYVKCFDLTAADLVYGDGEFVDEKDPKKVMRLWVSGNFRRWKVRFGWLPLHPTVYIRRAALNPDVLYDEQYRMAADTKFLIYYLHEYPLRICYLPQNAIRMRMGGLSTNPKHRRRMFLEDVKIYGDYGFSHPNLIKLMKMSWKVPQFINAILRRLHIPLSI